MSEYTYDAYSACGICTTLCDAAENGCLYHLNLFIDRGDDINFQEIDGEVLTPLHAAALNNRIQAVRFLVEKGADLNKLDCYDNTPLYAGVNENSSIDLLSILINAGSNIHHKNDQGDNKKWHMPLFIYILPL